MAEVASDNGDDTPITALFIIIIDNLSPPTHHRAPPHSHALSSKCLRKLIPPVDLYDLSCIIAVEVSSSTCLSAAFRLFTSIHSVATIHVDGEHCLDGKFPLS
jgi:hypothetical protein